MKKTREEFLQSMKEQGFGIEVELTGINRGTVTNLLSLLFENDELKDSQGREWKVKYDSSILSHVNYDDRCYEVSDRDYKVELTSPILGYSDIPLLLYVIRTIQQAGGVAGAKYRTGIHIHVNDEGHDHNTLRNLIRLVASKQYLLERALKIPDSRLEQYCNYVDWDLLEKSQRKYRNMNHLQSLWFDTSNRYSMLNLSSVFEGKGIELRLFNSTLNVNEVKAYIQFSLALCQSAKDLTRCSFLIPRNDENDAYAMRTWLCRMNLVGTEFKTCREVMLKNLTGDSAFADPNKRKI